MRNKKTKPSEVIIFGLWVISCFLMFLTIKHDGVGELILGIISAVYFFTCSILATIANVIMRCDE